MRYLTLLALLCATGCGQCHAQEMSQADHDGGPIPFDLEESSGLGMKVDGITLDGALTLDVDAAAVSITIGSAPSLELDAGSGEIIMQDGDRNEVLRFTPDGKTFLRGREISETDDRLVYEALRGWIADISRMFDEQERARRDDQTFVALWLEKIHEVEILKLELSLMKMRLAAAGLEER